MKLVQNSFCILCFTLVIVFFVKSLEAQVNERNWLDTNTMFTREEAKERFSFALKFNGGVSVTSFNKEKREYFASSVSINNEFGIALNKWNFAIGWGGLFETELKKEIIMQDQLLPVGSSFGIWRNSLNLGYSFDLIPKLSLQPKVGVVRIKHHPPRDMELNQFFKAYRSSGIELGISIYNYWPLRNRLSTTDRGFQFLAWFISFDRTFINYTDVYHGFGRNSFIIMLGGELKIYFYELKPKKVVK
jgi:hypothetical protein